MNTRLALGVPLATLVFAVGVAVALRAGGQTAEVTMGARPPIASAMVSGDATGDESRSPLAATTGTRDSAAEQMRYIFHELHADGRNAHCGICDSQYRTA